MSRSSLCNYSLLAGSKKKSRRIKGRKERLCDSWVADGRMESELSPFISDAKEHGKSVKRMVVDKWVIRQAEEPTEVCNTLLLEKQQIESSEPETIAG